MPTLRTIRSNGSSNRNLDLLRNLARDLKEEELRHTPHVLLDRPDLSLRDRHAVELLSVMNLVEQIAPSTNWQNDFTVALDLKEAKHRRLAASFVKRGANWPAKAHYWRSDFANSLVGATLHVEKRAAKDRVKFRVTLKTPMATDLLEADL
jgi:hypothetical protein